jgi:hypothetical protein
MIIGFTAPVKFIDGSLEIGAAYTTRPGVRAMNDPDKIRRSIRKPGAVFFVRFCTLTNETAQLGTSTRY